jgi:hypothetical protein
MERVQLSQSALPRLLGFGWRGHCLDFIILVGWKILIRRFTEEGVPIGAVEVGELGRISHNSGKPIIDRYMELGSDGACLEVEDQGDRTRVPITHPHVHVALRSRLPSRDLLAARDSVIENVNRTAPHMKISKFCLRPPSPGEDVDGGEAILLRGHTVPDIDGVSYGHWPELRIGDGGPVNGRVNQHRTGNGHDRLDVALGYTVVMMGADASKEGLLIELEDVFGKGLRSEVRTVVQQVLLWNHSSVSAHQLEGLLGLERFGRAECGLQLDMDIPGGRINENTASLVHLALLGLAFAGEQAASSGADEVIDRDPLSREELILS